MHVDLDANARVPFEVSSSSVGQLFKLGNIFAVPMQACHCGGRVVPLVMRVLTGAASSAPFTAHAPMHVLCHPFCAFDDAFEPKYITAL